MNKLVKLTQYALRRHPGRATVGACAAVACVMVGAIWLAERHTDADTGPLVCDFGEPQTATRIERALKRCLLVTVKEDQFRTIKYRPQTAGEREAERVQEAVDRAESAPRDRSSKLQTCIEALVPSWPAAPEVVALAGAICVRQ